MKILKYLKMILKNKVKIKGKGNQLDIDDVIVAENQIYIEGNNNYLKLGEKVKLKNSKIFIKGNNIRIDIEEKVNILESFFEIYGNNNKIFVGGGTSFSGVRLTSAEEDNKITIGKDCLFSYNIDIRNTDSHEIYENNIRINKGKEVILKDRVWIGEGVSILKGVVINSGNIIGAGSIVNKSILEENVIVVGNPAKIIRRNIQWKR